MPPRPLRVWGVFVPISRWALGRKLPSGAGGPLSSVGSSVGTVAGWTLQRGFPADDRGGARLSLEESRRKEHQGGRGSSSLDPPFLVWGTLRGSSLFSAWPAAHEPTPVTARPPAGRAGKGGLRRREGSFPPPKPSPWGEGGPAKPGRMRGRSCTQPFLVEKGVTDGRPNGFLLLLRWATRSPPHPSPSVTASPQGEASGLCSPTRKSVPNQGTYMGLVIAPRPQQCDTTAKTSECQRAAPNPGGAGLRPWTPGFMARSLSLARFGDRCLWYDSGVVTSGILRPIWDAFPEKIC